jgi:hypothetical protein
MTKIHKDICVLCTHLEDSLARWEQAGGYARVFGYWEPYGTTVSSCVQAELLTKQDGHRDKD